MYNKKFKKLLSALLAVMMVLSLSVTALADDPTGSGTAEGAGAPEGHVDKFHTDMVLPTITTQFNYTMDPEALIQETDAAKYAEGTVFPTENDTHVYFLTKTDDEGINTYANTTNTLYAVNIGTTDVKLTVKVKAVAGADPAKDIKLVASDALASETVPALYLGFTVNSDTKALTTAEQTIEKVIAGSANFETTYNKTTSKYEYTEKAPEDGAIGNAWNAAAITLTGSVNDKPITDDTTAPKVSVTWSWAKAGESDTADSAAVTVFAQKEEGAATKYLTQAEADAAAEAAAAAAEAARLAALPRLSSTSLDTDNRSFTINNGTLDRIEMWRENATEAIGWTEGNQYTIDGNTISVTDGPFSVPANRPSVTLKVFIKDSDGNAVAEPLIATLTVS